MNRSKATELAEALYQALSSGDRDTLDNLLHPRFTAHITPGMPDDLGGDYVGAAATRRDFWGRLGRRFDARACPDTFEALEQGGLIVRGHYQGVARTTGRSVNAEFIHELHFSDDKIVSLRQLTDSVRWRDALDDRQDWQEPRTLTFSVENGLAELRLNRPDQRNAIDLRMALELEQVATRCAEDPSIRALLISAAGPAFTVGGDLNFLGELPSRDLPMMLRRMTGAYHQALSLFERMPIPVITAAQGAAAGGGLGLLHVADLVYAAEDLRIASGFGALGLSMDGGNSWYLPRLLGQRRAAELYFEGRVLNAEEAVEYGLATRTVATADVLSEARAVALKIANGPTFAFGEARKLLRGGLNRTLTEHLVRETDALSRCAATKDAAIGLDAFIRRDKPKFTGG